MAIWEDDHLWSDPPCYAESRPRSHNSAPHHALLDTPFLNTNQTLYSKFILLTACCDVRSQIYFTDVYKIYHSIRSVHWSSSQYKCKWNVFVTCLQREKCLNAPMGCLCSCCGTNCFFTFCIIVGWRVVRLKRFELIALRVYEHKRQNLTTRGQRGRRRKTYRILRRRHL